MPSRQLLTCLLAVCKRLYGFGIGRSQDVGGGWWVVGGGWVGGGWWVVGGWWWVVGGWWWVVGGGWWVVGGGWWVVGSSKVGINLVQSWRIKVQSFQYSRMKGFQVGSGSACIMRDCAHCRHRSGFMVLALELVSQKQLTGSQRV